MKQINYNEYINYLIVVYAFTLPLSRAAIVFFSALIPLLWILEGDFQRKFKLLLLSKVLKVIIAFIVFNLLAVLWSDYMLQALEYIQKYWYFLPMFVIFTSIKKEYISKTLSAFILGMFVSEVISYGIYFEWWQFKNTLPENPSPFMHHIEYSVFLAFTALVLLGRIFNEENIKYTLLYIFFFATVSGNLFLTAGRTGQIAFILGLFVLAMLSFKNKLKAFFVSIILSALVLGIAFNVSTTFYERIMTGKESLVNVVEKKDYCSSWGSRVGVWIVAEDIMLEHPILGVGVSDNMTEFHNLLSANHPEMECIQGHLMHMHNQYIQVFTQMGLIGLVIFLGIFYAIIKLPIKDVEYRNIQYVYVVIVLFAFVSEVLYHRQFSMALFALIIGLLLAQNKVENEI
jgi:O-antigen ligase